MERPINPTHIQKYNFGSVVANVGKFLSYSRVVVAAVSVAFCACVPENERLTTNL